MKAPSTASINLHKILFCGLFLFNSSLLFSQVVGGRGNSESVPTTVKPADLAGNSYGGDVNLFNGTYNGSYTLGTVATPGGLSYTLSLNYSSVVTGGHNAPIASGIPYGEGWNLSVPTVSVSSEAYTAFSEMKYCQYKNAVLSLQANDTDITSFYYSLPYDNVDGDVFWYAPYISIPGVVSGRAVFKYFSDGSPVFVLQHFEQYVELHFGGTSWTVLLEDGTVYEFNLAQRSFRNGANRRIFNYKSDELDGNTIGPAVEEKIKNTVLPKEEMLQWYCTGIYNRNHLHPQMILFSYEKFGAFNYFNELTFKHQPGIANLLLDEAATAQDAEKFVTYSDVLLTAVYSKDNYTPIDSIRLNYSTISALAAHDMLLQGGQGVKRLDSLYNYKSVFYEGEYNPAANCDVSPGGPTANGLSYIPAACQKKDFEGWKRFLHVAHNDLPGITTSAAQFANALNPYVHTSTIGASDNEYYYEEAGGQKLSFNHGFLESPRIGGANSDPQGTDRLVPGDIYEIRTVVQGNSANSAQGLLNFDINIATGFTSLTSTDPLNPVIGTIAATGSTPEIFKVSAFDKNRLTRQSIFSTFNQAVKWNTKGRGFNQGVQMITSNFFAMPYVNPNFDGFNIQIGPASSDNFFNATEQNVSTGGTRSAFYSYPRPGYDLGIFNEPAFSGFRASDPPPANFGVGLPWYQMRHLNSKLQQSSILPDPDADMFKFWWRKDNIYFSYPNVPTLADENTFLKAVELLRYSKNPYMLTSVDIYQTNGEITENNRPGDMLVGRLELDYSVFSIRRVANEYFGPVTTTNPPAYAHYWKNAFLLKNIRTIPVDPSRQSPPVLTASQKSILPTVHFLYDTLANDFFFTGDKRSAAAGVVLSKIINHLGGTTEIEYYSDTSGYVSRRFSTYSPCATSDELASLSKSMNAVQIHFPVKAVKVRDNNGNIQQRDYSFGVKARKKVFTGESLKLNRDHFSQRYSFEQYGYDTLTVLEPAINGKRAKTLYINYTDTAGYAFFGKVKRTERYDGDNMLLSKDEFFYDRLLAYRNGASRIVRLVTPMEYDYQDYHEYPDDNFTGLDTTGLADMFNRFEISSAFAIEAMRFYETPRLLYAPYLDTVRIGESYVIQSVIPDTNLTNSYFIKKTRDIMTEYEQGCAMSFKNDTATGGGGFDNKAQNPDKAQIIAIINNDPNQEAIEQVLMNQSPLEDAVLKAMLNRQPSLNEDRIKRVLMHQPDLTDNVMKEMIQRNNLSDGTLKDVLVRIPHHLSESVQLEMAHRIPAVGNQTIKEVSVKHSPLTDNLLKEHIARKSFTDKDLEEILLAQRRNSDAVLLDWEERDPSPSEEALRNVLLKQPDISEEVMQGAENRQPPLEDSLLAELRRRTVNRQIADFATACNGVEVNPVLAITRVTEYEWFDAPFNGFTASQGFRKLMNIPCNDVELKYEPSWQLYRKNTYSPQYAGAFNQQEYFYYYDLLNRYNNHCLPSGKKTNPIGIDPNPGPTDPKDTAFIPQLKYFCGVKTALNANLRNIAFEQRNTSKNISDDNALVRSSYFIYDCDWLEFPPVNYEQEETGGDPCAPPPAGTDSATVIKEVCIECSDGLFNNNKWSCFIHNGGTIGQDDIPFGYAMYEVLGQPETHYFICPIGTFDENNPSVNVVYYNGIVAAPDPNGIVKRQPGASYDFQLFLRSTFDQLDTLPLSDYGGPYGVKHEVNPLLDFTAIRDPDHAGRSLWLPSFPYDALQAYKVHERNEYGQVELEEDVKGLKTRYYYAPKTIKFLIDTVCFQQSFKGAVNTNIGLPLKVTSGVGLNDSLVTALDYYPDNSIAKITDPNLMELKYEYDIFGRMEKSFRNGIKTQLNRYHTWQNDTNLSFSQRLTENYVETFIFNNDNDSAAERTRAYLDPLGREHNIVSILTPNAFLSSADSAASMVHTGEIVYDTWNRRVRSYKPFVFDSSGLKIGIIPRLKSTNTSLYPNAFSAATFENSHRSRKLREAKPGQDIDTGKVVKYRYENVNYLCFYCELGLTMKEAAEIMPGDASQYIFQKTEIEDEDGKITAEYFNALDQKVATKQVASNAQESITLFFYDSYGNLARTVNPEKQASTYDYNILGWLYRKQNPDGGITKYMYNKEGKVTLEQDANAALGGKVASTGSATVDSLPYFRQYFYDEFGRMTKQRRVIFNLCDPDINPLYYADKPTPNNLSANNCEWFYKMSNNATYDWSGGMQQVTGGGAGNNPAYLISMPLSALKVNSEVEKQWFYGSASLTVNGGIDPATIHDNGRFFTDKGRTFMKGRLSHTLVCGNNAIDFKTEETRNPVKYCFYSYNADGETLWQLQQFNPGGISSLRKGMTVRLDYPQYNTRGSLLNEVVDVNSDMLVDMGYQFVYDGRNRLREVYAGLTDSAKYNDLLARYSYNDAVGLVTKTTYHRDCNVGVGSSFKADSITYSYDVRDRLTELNSSLFNYRLFYDRDIPFYYDCPMNADTNFNGNINGTIATWKLKNSNKDPGNFSQPTYYGYRYDGLNRLVAADGILGDLTQPASSPHCQPEITIGDEIMQYDRIGNIQVLQRTLPPSSGTNPVTATWKYSYQTGTSRLKQIKNMGGFGQWQYKYDPAGNTTRDEYRVVQDVEYGRANLPFTMQVQTDKKENYLYDAQDMRIYKEMRPLVISESQFTPVDNPEFYLRDMAGNEIGILDIAKANWTWYGFGRERFARMIPAKNQQAQFFARDNGSGSDNSGSLETKLRNELRDHTLVKGRIFPEKLIEADIRQKPNDPAVRMVVTETKLKEMQNNKPSLKADIIQEANIEHEKQQLIIKESDGTQKRMSAEELIKQPGDASLSLSRSGNLPATPASGSFVMPPYQYNANKVLGSVSYFIFDHLNTSRVVYKPNVNCNGGGVSYTLEYVGDFFSYGRQLRTYVSGIQEKYISTGNERDKETGYDWRTFRGSDPDDGRFKQMDIMAAAAPSWSPYRYGFCNPVNFVDPSGLWEFKIKTNEDGKKQLALTGQEGDNFRTLRKQTGLSRKELKSYFNKEERKALGKGSEITALGDKFEGINTALNTEEDVTKCNCFNTAIDFSLNGKVDFSEALDSYDADAILTTNFKEATNAKFGDVIRYARPDGYATMPGVEDKIKALYPSEGQAPGGASHYANFLLKNREGIQVFTKNGFYAKPAIMYQKQLLQEHPDYGVRTGLNGGFSIYTPKK